jgi:hypothetical protein
MGNKKALGLLLLIFCIIGMTACSANTIQLQTLSAQEIETLGKTCEDIARLQIETWDTRDAEKLREIYTEDIVHFDSR